jgi:hypothetical protein
MSLILCIILASMGLVFASGLLSCLCIAKHSEEQSERLFSLLIKENGGSMKLLQQNIGHFITIHN